MFFGPGPGAVTNLSLFGFVHGVLLVAVDANVYKFAFRPSDSLSMQFFKPSLFHGIADDRYPCGVPALASFRTNSRVACCV